jgi:hypothetical protein
MYMYICVLKAPFDRLVVCISVGEKSSGGTSEEHVPCQEDFFREEEGGLCFPRCESWREYSDSETIATDVVILSAGVIGVISGLAFTVISIIRLNKMYVVIPSVIIDPTRMRSKG